jgi:hypothetical protein
MKLSNLDTSLFWTMDTFFRSHPQWRTSWNGTVVWFHRIFGIVSEVENTNSEYKNLRKARTRQKRVFLCRKWGFLIRIFLFLDSQSRYFLFSRCFCFKNFEIFNFSWTELCMWMCTEQISIPRVLQQKSNQKEAWPRRGKERIEQTYLFSHELTRIYDFWSRKSSHRRLTSIAIGRCPKEVFSVALLRKKPRN